MKWGELITLEYGKPVADKVCLDGNVPVYGTNGQIGTSHLSPLCKHASFIIGRKGAYRGVHYSNVPFSAIDTAFFVEPISNLIDLKWAYYKFLTYDINRMDSGSAIPSTDRYEIYGIEVDIPSIEYQKKVVSILESIDEKIKTNQEVNDNLYEMVNAYYVSLFKYEKGEMTTIGDYADRIYSGGTPTTSNAAYWNGAFGWFSSGETRNRFVISTEKTITQAGVDNSSTKLAAKHDIVMASAGQGFTRGQTSMLLLDTYVNQSVIVIHASKTVLPYLFWNLANRYEELRAISDSSSIRGSLTTKMISAFAVPRADSDALQAFSDFAWSVIPQIENCLLENARLAELRDSLLPQLMSGEIDVSDVQL